MEDRRSAMAYHFEPPPAGRWSLSDVHDTRNKGILVLDDLRRPGSCIVSAGMWRILGK